MDGGGEEGVCVRARRSQEPLAADGVIKFLRGFCRGRKHLRLPLASSPPRHYGLLKLFSTASNVATVVPPILPAIKN